jgi:hypothetical protein
MIKHLRVDIQIELLTFQDGIGHIDKSLRDGYITEGMAHKLKNQLARIYAERIATLVKRGR